MDAVINDRVTIGDNSGQRTRCIFRAHGDRAYTKLRNAFLQDKRISDETRGLVARLLSLPDDWEITVKQIIASGKAGRDKVYRMLKEAEKHGYIKPEQVHDDQGKFGRQLYLVSDDPDVLIRAAADELYAIEKAMEDGEYEPFPENPEADKPETEEPLTEKPETVYEQPVSGKTVNGETAYGKTVYGKAGSTKKNIEEEININNTPLLIPPESEKPEPKKPKRKGRGDKTRLAEDWVLDDEWRRETKDVFKLTDAQIDHVARQFHRYWTGPDATKPMKADWKRTWENWVDRALQKGIRVPGSAGQSPPGGGPQWAQDREARKVKTQEAIDALLALEQSESK